MCRGEVVRLGFNSSLGCNPFRLQNGDILQVLVAAQFKSDNTMEYAFYVADFEYAGVHYRVKTENIESWYLDTLIREIVK